MRLSHESDSAAGVEEVQAKPYEIQEISRFFAWLRRLWGVPSGEWMLAVLVCRAGREEAQQVEDVRVLDQVHRRVAPVVQGEQSIPEAEAEAAAFPAVTVGEDCVDLGLGVSLTGWREVGSRSSAVRNR